MDNTREKLIELLKSGGVAFPISTADHLIANGVTVLPITGIGDMSDGYHTFNELYHHRAMLFSVICNTMPKKAWKSKKHDDGTMYDGMFIVGIETPEGQATYHYDIDPYWEMFDVKELENAPMWDGHTPDIAIRRIAMLGFNGVTLATDNNVGDKWIPVTERLPDKDTLVLCIGSKGGMFLGYVRFLYCEETTAYTIVPNARGSRYTKYWMPLPEPPKGD